MEQQRTVQQQDDLEEMQHGPVPVEQLQKKKCGGRVAGCQQLLECMDAFYPSVLSPWYQEVDTTRKKYQPWDVKNHNKAKRTRKRGPVRVQED